MDSKPNWPNRQLADGYNFVDAASAGFDGAVLTIPSSLTGFQQTAFGYVQGPDGGTTMCFGGILTSCSSAPCCPECGRRMHINGTVTGEIKHVPFGTFLYQSDSRSICTVARNAVTACRNPSNSRRRVIGSPGNYNRWWRIAWHMDST